MKTLRLIPLLLLCSCATWNAWYAKPESKQAINQVANGVISYFTGNVTGAALDAISGASLLVRSLQSTPNADSPGAVKQAVVSAGSPPAIARIVFDAIEQQTSAGVAPNVANENASKGLDKAVAALTTP